MIGRRPDWMSSKLDYEYTLNLNLTRFVGAELMEIEDSDGRPIKGVFIPVALNNLFIPDKTRNVWANINLLRRRNAVWPETHDIVTNWPLEHADKVQKLGYGRSPRKLGKAYRLNKNSDPKMNAKQRYER